MTNYTASRQQYQKFQNTRSIKAPGDDKCVTWALVCGFNITDRVVVDHRITNGETYCGRREMAHCAFSYLTRKTYHLLLYALFYRVYPLSIPNKRLPDPIFIRVFLLTIYLLFFEFFEFMGSTIQRLVSVLSMVRMGDYI